MKDGEWVQDYTKHGSPRQGHRRYRWISTAEKYGEYAALILIAVIIFSAVLLPAILSDT